MCIRDRSYNNPFNLLLTLLAAVSCFTRDTQAAVVIGSMVLLATLILSLIHI